MDIDPVTLETILKNALANASDATQGLGSVEVRASVANGPGACDACGADASGSWFAVEIADDGPGLPAAARRGAIEPLLRTNFGDHASSTGLAVVSGIVHGHGGHVQLECPPGGGTRLRVLISRSEARAPAAPPETVPGSPGPLVTGRIAVVDDEPGIAAMMREALASHGHPVDAFTSSDAALRALARDRDAYDLLVTDQSMPGLSGERLVHEVRQLRPDLPVILATGYSDVVDERVVKRWGRARLLLKPLSLDVLRSTAAELIRERLAGMA